MLYLLIHETVWTELHTFPFSKIFAMVNVQLFISFRVIQKFLANISRISAAVFCFEQLTSAHI
jgi:hypothetical protein